MKTKLILLIVAFSCTFLHPLQAQKLEGKGFQQLAIGDIEGVVLSDGFFHFKPIQAAIAPAATTKELHDFMEKNHDNPNSVDLALNILLLKKGERYILFDAGAGSGMGATAGWLLQNLANIGIPPSQITDVFITHAHPDHIFGLVDGQGKSIFANATVYIPAVEYDFWVNRTPDFSKSKNPQKDDKEALGGMIMGIRNALAILKPQLKMIADGDVLLDCVKVRLAPGHTKGHSMYTISSKAENLTVIGDLVHSSQILFTHPEWGTTFDWNFELGVKTRKAMLKEFNDKKSVIFGQHLGYPGVGRITNLATDSYEWIPRYVASPQIKN